MPEPAGDGPIPPRRVLLLAKGLGPGGMERLLVNHLLFGDRRRFEYSVAYANPDKQQLVTELEALGVDVHPLAGGSGNWARSLRTLLASERYDVVHAHSPLLAVAARLLARTLRPRPALVYTEHNSWGAYSTPTRLANRLTYRLDDAQLAVSVAARDSVPPGSRGRLEVLDHGIDLESVRPHVARRDEARGRLGVTPEQLVIGTVANFRPEKNYAGLLRVADAVTSARPDVVFVSIGQGPLFEDVERQRHAAGLAQRFRLMGHQPDAPSLMAGFDVFAMASHWEGLPVAFMEARALGLPVVVTSVGGLTDHVQDGVDGLLVPARDDSALETALLRVIDDPDLRHRLSVASADAASTFDARSVAAEVERRYDSALARRRTSPVRDGGGTIAAPGLAKGKRS